MTGGLRTRRPELKGLEGGQYRPLSQGDIERIHQATLEIFEEVGLEVCERRALELFAEQGAIVDKESKVARLPRKLVERALASAPSKVVLYGREERHNLVLEGKRVHLLTGGTAVNVLDPDTGQKRPSNLEDVRRIARLCDTLDHIHSFMLPVFPNELPREQVDPNRFYAALCNTTKHVTGGVWHPEGLKNAIKVAAFIAGGYEELRRRPIISMICCVISPFRLDEDYTSMMILAAENGIPLMVPTEPLAGASSPVTVAGTVLQSNAETLGAVMLTQLVNPGTPVLYSTVASIADPRRLAYCSGAVEMGLIQAASAQMAQFYRLPIYATAGMSDSKLPDAQAGYEKAMTSVMVALAGANYIHDSAGLLEFAMTACYEQYVIDNEINGMVMQAVRGIDTSEEALALDVIKELARSGNFFEHPHTYSRVRDEFYLPMLSDRLPREEWEQKGSKDARQRAKEYVQQALATHQVAVPIPPEVDRRIRETVPGMV